MTIACDVVFKPQMCMSPKVGVQEANGENYGMPQQKENNSELEDFSRNDEMLQQIENNFELVNFSRNYEMSQQIEDENQTDQPYSFRNQNLITRTERFGEFDTGLSCLSEQGDVVTFKEAVEGENNNS
ncbi:hypothetical protein JTB14_016649 [Gonioctena quinquepunctata]|nr:hypothetical protein JTB14_016649 [Gonioctena quinquepunctata]